MIESTPKNFMPIQVPDIHRVYLYLQSFCLQFLIFNSVPATNVVESRKVTVTFSLKIPLQRVSFQAPQAESTVHIHSVAKI